MKFIRLILFFLTLLFYVFPTKSYAEDVVEHYFYSNNRSNTTWQVGFRVVGNTDASNTSNWDYGPTWTRLVDRNPPGGYPGNQATWAFIWSGPLDDPVNNFNPSNYRVRRGVQWGTGCIDPVPALLPGEGSQLAPGLFTWYAGTVNVTHNDAGVNYFEANGGGTIWFRGFHNTNNCPQPPPPPPPTGRSATTSCVDLNTSRINFEWNPIDHDDYYEFRYRRANPQGSWNNDTVGTARGSDGKIHHVVNVADNTVFEWEVNGHTTGNWPGPTGWSNTETVRSANNSNCQTRDLDITAFRFPDGIEGKTSDVRVTIHNRGNTQIPNNFDVTVNNGDPNRGPGWSRTYRVTQTVSADESILLDSHFQNMPLPPVRSNPYTATATVDSARPDEVNESREDNNTATDNYTVFPLINPWFQGVGGDMRSDGGSSVTVPTGEYFSITQGALSSPGIIFNYNISGNLSSKNWKVSGSNFAGRSIKTSYDYVTGAIKKGGITTFGLFGRKSPCGSDDKPNCNLNGNSQDIEKGFYTYNGSPPLNVTINGNYNFQGGGYYVFVINGNLTINSNRLTVAKDGTSVLFVVSGNITVSDNVTNLEGIFSADGNFRVNSKTPATDNQLEIQGSVIANSVKGVGKFDNQRDLGNRANITTPAVVIIYRPDLILNAPNLIRSTNYKFQEVAPRGNP